MKLRYLRNFLYLTINCVNIACDIYTDTDKFQTISRASKFLHLPSFSDTLDAKCTTVIAMSVLSHYLNWCL